jgi:hypothetical protein
MSDTPQTLDFKASPSGPTYTALLECSLRFATRLMLVVRASIPLDASANELLNDLKDYLLSTEDRSKWPGTQLLQGRAQVYTFRLNEQVLSILSKAANGLFEWQQPGLPEDPALLREDGSPWLTTISHERDAFVTMSLEELAELKEECPMVASLLE